MGDRCDLTIYYRPEDQQRVLDILFDGEDDFSDICTDHGAIEARVYQVNYGLYDELQALAKAGVPFEGSHGPGGSYDGAVFASDGKEYANCVACADMGGPVALVNSDGTVDFAMKREADLYWRLRPLADALLYPDYCPKCGKEWAEHKTDGVCPPRPHDLARLLPAEVQA